MKQATGKKSKSTPTKNRKPAVKAKAKPVSKAKAKTTAKQVATVKAKAKAKAASKPKTPAKPKAAAVKKLAAKPAKATKATGRTTAPAKRLGAKLVPTTRKAPAKVSHKQAAPVRNGAATAARATAKSAQPDTRSTEGLSGALAALKLGLEKKAVEPMLLDLRDLCSYTNYRLLLSGRSDRQVDAIADGVVAGLREAGVRHLSKERTDARSWTLIDFGDFIVDVFHHPSREHYDLESLWNDAPRVAIEIPAEARLGAAEAYA